MVVKGIVRIGERIMLVAGVAALLIIILSVSAGIVSRYVFNSPFPWTEELATFLFIWLSFMGAGVAAARRKHVVVDFISSRLGESGCTRIRAVSCGLIILFLILVSAGAILLQPKTATHASVTLGIPKNLYYLPVLIASVYMIFIYINELSETLRAKP